MVIARSCSRARGAGRLPYLVLLSAAALGACGRTPVTGPASVATNLVTPTQAHVAVGKYDQVARQAEDACNAALNDTAETGDLATIDDPELRPWACKPTPTPTPTPTPAGQGPSPSSPDAVVLPRGTGYPADFLHFGTANDGPRNAPAPNLWVMESAGRGAPWKAKWQVVFDAQSPQPDFAIDEQGYAPALLGPAATGYALTPASTCDAAAQFFNAGYSGGTAPTSMTAAPGITSYQAALLSADRTGDTAGEQISARTWSCGGSVIGERTRDGSALMVFTLVGKYSWTFLGGRATVVGPDHRDSSGGLQLVAPGTYQALNETELIMLAARVPKHGATTLPQLIGVYRGVTEATGVAA